MKKKDIFVYIQKAVVNGDNLLKMLFMGIRQQKFFINFLIRNKIDTEWQILHNSGHVRYKPKLFIVTQSEIATVLVKGSGGRDKKLLLNKYKDLVV